MRQWERAAPLTVMGVVFALYFIGGSLAWWTINESGLGAVFFPPAGITVVAFLTLPRSRWIYAAIAILFGEIATGIVAGDSDDLPSLIGFGIANLAEPLVGALLVLRLLGRTSGVGTAPDLGRRRELTAFVGAAALVAPVIGGTIGSLTAMWRFDTDFWPLAPQWWLGDALGVLVVGPLFLAWFSTRGVRSWLSPLALGLVALTALGAAMALWTTDKPMLFLVLAGMVVGGAIFDVRTVALAGAIVAIVVGIALSTQPDQMIAALAPSTALTIIKVEFLVFAAISYAVAAEANERTVYANIASSRLETVGELQRLLLPPAEMAGEGFRVRGVYDAAVRDVGVGGDWYLVRPTLDGRLVFAVGDIVGHDVDAARTMASVRSGLVLEGASDPRPERLLEKLDRFARVEPSIRYSTAWVGVYDPEAQILEYACAGHVPPLLVRPGERIARLDQANTALIALAQGERFSARIEVPPGSTLLMFTDGLVERRDNDLDEGISDLVDVVAEFGTDPEVVLDRMLVDSARDDDTILAVLELGHDDVAEAAALVQTDPVELDAQA